MLPLKQSGRLSKSKGFTRLRGLKCFPEVHQKLKEGWPLPHVARFIQEEQHEYTDISKSGLVSTLHKYKQTIPQTEIIQNAMPAAIANKIEETVKKLDELEALYDLYKIQKARIDMDHKVETTIKKSLNTLGNEIRVARELLESSANLKMEIGIIKKQAPEPQPNIGMDLNVKVEHIDTAPASVQKILANPQSRHKLLSIAKNLLLSSAAQTVKTETASEAVVVMDASSEG